MFSSTIIPTIGRSSLKQAVLSVLDQDFTHDDFEVVVVNDSGKPLPDEEWQHSNRVHIVNTNQRERSAARNVGAAVARGEYLHFLDDDDLLLPGALKAFWELCEQKEAIWYYGSYQTVDNEGNILDEFHPDVTGNVFSILVAGESFPFQVSLISSDHFFLTGGFDTSPLILGVEDRDVGRRLALHGSVAYTSAIVARIRIGEVGSTTNWSAIADRDRWGREKALNLPGSYVHIRNSTKLCLVSGRVLHSYMCGRALRAYIASMVWNLQHNNYFVATSRSIAGLSLASSNIFNIDFWRGIRA